MRRSQRKRGYTYGIVHFGADFLPKTPALSFDVCRAMRHLTLDLGRDVVRITCRRQPKL
jgi:hypothetical protein